MRSRAGASRPSLGPRCPRDEGRGAFEVRGAREKALEVRQKVLHSGPARGIKEEMERGLLRAIEKARADILGKRLDGATRKNVTNREAFRQ